MPISLGVGSSYRNTKWSIGVGSAYRSVGGIWIGVGSTWRQCYAPGVYGTLSAVQWIDASFRRIGFTTLVSFQGSLSPRTLPDGREVVAVHNTLSNGRATVSINGFPGVSGGEPGYLDYVVVNGVLLHASNASFAHASASGVSTWTWTSDTFNLSNGGSYSALIALS